MLSLGHHVSAQGRALPHESVTLLALNNSNAVHALLSRRRERYTRKDDRAPDGAPVNTGHCEPQRATDAPIFFQCGGRKFGVFLISRKREL